MFKTNSQSPSNELNSAHPRLWEGNQTRCPVISKVDKHMVHTSTAQSEWKKLLFWSGIVTNKKTWNLCWPNLNRQKKTIKFSNINQWKLRGEKYQKDNIKQEWFKKLKWQVIFFFTIIEWMNNELANQILILWYIEHVSLCIVWWIKVYECNSFEIVIVVFVMIYTTQKKLRVTLTFIKDF